MYKYEFFLIASFIIFVFASISTVKVLVDNANATNVKIVKDITHHTSKSKDDTEVAGTNEHPQYLVKGCIAIALISFISTWFLYSTTVDIIKTENNYHGGYKGFFKFLVK